MNSADAKFVARFFNEILDTDASTFVIPARKTLLPDGSPDPDAPKVARRYGVVLDQSGQMFGSVLAAKQFINEG